MNLTLDNILTLGKEEFLNLSKSERDVIVKILQEVKESGTSPTLDSIWMEDYEEIPVDIDTFICDERYLGKSTRKGTSIYPFWRQQYREIFAVDAYRPQVVLTGAIGIGKTRTAVVCLCYMLYKLMCLKNPQEYFNFNEGDTISILFFNITLDLAEGVAYKTMQEYLQASPWFMERGVVTGIKNKIYNPPKKIALTFGSKPEHALGQQVYCLTGDTPIHTTQGIYNIEDLEGHKFQVYCYNPVTGLCEISKPVTCKQTNTVTQLIELTLLDGTVIRGTPKHQLAVANGYKPMNEIYPGMVLCTCGECGDDKAQSGIPVMDKRVLQVPPTPVYDIINSKPYHNFVIPTNTPGVQIVSHNCAILDEIDFAKGGNVKMEQSKIMETYSAVSKRITSRFIKNGLCVGKLFLVSSKKSEYDFLESFVRKMSKDEEEAKKLHIVDEPLWVVKPSSVYSGKKFKVAVGNKLLVSQVIPKDATEEQIDALIKQGYEIMEVPVEHRGDFITDINRALMDIAGRSVIGTTSFFNYELFSKCYVERKNPFTADTLQIGRNDPLNIADFFKPDEIDYKIKRMPIYVHVDTSLSGDKTGISAVAVAGKKRTATYMGAEEVVTEEIMYTHVFTVYIQAPQGSEISLEKNRQFIYYLSQIGFNIYGVSLDGFQSADTRQILEAKGYNAKIRSLDKTPDGYLVTRSAMNDGRIGLIRIEPLETELVQLQRDNVTGKLDHPMDGCFTADTSISLVDGRELTITELLQEQSEGKTNYVYTFNETTKRIEPKPIRKVFYTKTPDMLLKVTLDNGESFRCTPEHLFMLRDGTYLPIQDIPVGQSLMPLYRKYSESAMSQYRLYYEPVEQRWHYEHRSFCVDPPMKHSVVHHRNFNKGDNTPPNLQRMLTSDHITYHNREQSEEERQKRSDTVTKWHEENRGTPEYEMRAQKTRESVNQYYADLHKDEPGYVSKLQQYKIKHQQIVDTIKREFGVDFDSLSPSEKDSYSVKAAYIINPKLRDTQRENSKRAYESKKDKFNARGRHWYTNGIDNVYLFDTDVIPEGYHRGRTYPKKEYKNHKVVSIEWVRGGEPVYDLEIEDNHNFALTAGVFVHNSKDGSDSLAGAIWNASEHVEEYSMDLELMTSIAEVNDDTDAETNFKQAFRDALSEDYTKRAQSQMDRLFNDTSGDDGIFVW